MKSHVILPNSQAPCAVPSRARLLGRFLLRTMVMLPTYLAIVLLPAGTWHFWQAWAFLVSVFLPVAASLLWLIFADPQTAQRRMEEHEPTRTQRNLRRYFALVFVLILLVPGFDHRFGWTRTLLRPVPAWLCLTADLLAFAGVAFAFWSVFANRFAARTIRVERGQEVISSGPYLLVRHPLYAGSCLMLFSMTVALGSLVSLPLVFLCLPFYVIRLLDEEKMLARDLPGYTEYCQRTRWRLIPFVW